MTIELTDAQLERYARHVILDEVGEEGQARLLAAFRAADSTGRAGILLAARGIAALARQDPGAYHDADAAAAKKPAARKKAA